MSFSMLTEVCNDLRNWFNRDLTKHEGTWHIVNNNLLETVPNLQAGQYYLIRGSLFNDGVHLYPVDELRDEVFTGMISPMVIPADFVALVEDIEAWQKKYGDVDSAAMSPYSSESFGGYSYTKSAGGSEYGTIKSGTTWQTIFAGRLNRYRKI